jgi:hypothetical protein
MNVLSAWLILSATLAAPVTAGPQTAQHSPTLSVAGQSGHATVVHIHGKSYVEVESLARLMNGSLSFSGNQVKLTLPSGAASPAAATPPEKPGFSKGFLRAGIETMSGIREWRSVIDNIIQRSYPFDAGAFSAYSAAAARNLNLAFVAASTESDRSAYQLLSNELNNMRMLTDQVLDNKKVMRYMPPGYLEGDPLNQRILSCAQSLESMAASGQFVDDGSCR